MCVCVYVCVFMHTSEHVCTHLHVCMGGKGGGWNYKLVNINIVCVWLFLLDYEMDKIRAHLRKGISRPRRY